jgi:hypothetical protein
MRHTIGPTRLGATLLALTLTLVACGRSGGTDTEDAFCPVMEQVATRMAPSAEPTPPAEVETSFGEVVTLLDQAERTAPSELRGDVTRYAAAIDDYVVALAAVDFDLDAIFSTPEGAQLAQDTSHALTPEIVNYMTGPCGISLG